MSKKKIPTCCLVIDASIARAAGSLDSKHPIGVLCRDFLMRVRSVCHRIAWTEPIKLEWDKHASVFASQWRVSMLNLDKRREKLRRLKDAPSSEIRESIQKQCTDGEILAILLKDCHLIEAALETDLRVASLDEQVRRHLAALAAAVETLRPIIWVNPAVAEEEAVEWLEKGAPAEKKRRLKSK
jgi:hypothetical protein